VKIFGREPTLYIALIGSVLTWLAGINLDWINAGQATAITTALTGIAIAITTRPIAPGLFVAAFGLFGSLLAEYGTPLSQTTIASVGGIILAAFALLGVRPQVTPVADPRTIDGEVVRSGPLK
jgi:hypothetical protein